MPDAARVAQAQALEVPVILQGAKTADETGKRELFTENATTTLVFENGAVLNLRSKLTVGQAIFIHNQQNGREILCKVIEAPAEGHPGYTDLEFTSADPEFWHANAQPSKVTAPNPQAAAEHPATIQQPAAPGDDTLAMMSQSASNVVLPAQASLREELVPAHEIVPQIAIPEAATRDFEPAVSAEGNQPTEPTGDQIDAALRQMAGAPPGALPGTDGAAPHGEGVEDEKHLAALMARDARFAKYAAIKEKQVDKIQKDAAVQGAPAGAPAPEAVSEEIVVPAKPPLMDRLTTGKNAIIVEVAACVVIAVALGFVWHAMRGLFIHDADQPVAAAVQPKPKAVSASKPLSPGTGTGNGKGAPTTAPAPAQASSKAPQANGTKAAAPTVKIAPAASGSVSTARVTHAGEAPTAPARDSVAAKSDIVVTDGAAEQPKHRKAAEASPAGIVPAKIVSQPQPSFPDWAKGLDVDGVVTLEVLIDENGNVAQTKVLSGPRELRHAAEQAVGLWQFEPALSGGKPIATYMVLTVEFQR